MTVASLDVSAEGDFVFAAGLGGEGDAEPGVAAPPISENLCGRDGGANGEVAVYGLRVYRAGEGDLQICPRVDALVANHARSMCWIADDLNRRGIPGPTEGKWSVQTVKNTLRRRV